MSLGLISKCYFKFWCSFIKFKNLGSLLFLISSCRVSEFLFLVSEQPSIVSGFLFQHPNTTLPSVSECLPLASGYYFQHPNTFLWYPDTFHSSSSSLVSSVSGCLPLASVYSFQHLDAFLSIRIPSSRNSVLLPEKSKLNLNIQYLLILKLMSEYVK